MAEAQVERPGADWQDAQMNLPMEEGTNAHGRWARGNSV